VAEGVTVSGDQVRSAAAGAAAKTNRAYSVIVADYGTAWSASLKRNSFFAAS
jgi:hypothetical protein